MDEQAVCSSTADCLDCEGEEEGGSRGIVHWSPVGEFEVDCTGVLHSDEHGEEEG